jgi:hypothetical protein
MATEAPTDDREYLLKLMKLVERYDFEKLLDAATAFCDWTVISGDEKKDIESQSSKQSRLDRLLMILIAETGRAARFANFILRYNSPIQAAALAVVNSVSDVAGSETRPTAAAGAAPTSTSSQMRYYRPEMQQPADDIDSQDQKSSATATGSPMDTESPEACSMDTDSKVSLWIVLASYTQAQYSNVVQSCDHVQTKHTDQ